MILETDNFRESLFILTDPFQKSKFFIFKPYMADNRPVLLIAFSNDQDNTLPYLVNEMKGIESILSKHDYKFKPVKIYNATLKEIKAEITNYADRIVFFMYSGHADENKIKTVDDETSLLGLSKQLQKCPNLKITILNGCNSGIYLKTFKDAISPILIATSSPVGDKAASFFSVTFIDELMKGNTVSEAFDISLEDATNYRTTPIEELRVSEDRVRFLEEIQDDQEINQWFLMTDSPKDEEWSFYGEDTSQIPISNYQTNNHLHKNLYDWFSKEDAEISKYENFKDVDNKILEKFPYFISKFIYDLYAIPITLPNQNFTSKGYIEPKINRLIRTIDFFSAIQEVLFSLVLAEIRECFIHSKPDQLQESFNVPLLNIEKFNKHENIKAGLNWLKSIPKETFLHELGSISIEKIEKISTFFDEVNLQSYKYRRTPEFTNNLVVDWCEKAEIHITEFLNEVKFLINYTFLTIKNIEIYKNRTNPTASFGIKPAIYEWRTASNEVAVQKENKAISVVPDTYSVLIVRKKEKIPESLQNENYLNLSPFLIDKNVVYDKATNTFIASIKSLKQNNLTYTYRSILDSSNQPISGENKSFIYEDIDKQFTHFINLISSKNSE